MTIVGEAVAPIIMGYCGYYGEYGDCLSYTAGMLWGDWRVCTVLTLRLPLAKKEFFSKITPSLFFDKASCTRQFESELSLHSLASLFPLKEGSTSHPDPLSSGAREKTALLGARNRYVLRLVGHQSPRHLVRAGTAWGKLVCCVSYSCKLC